MLEILERAAEVVKAVVTTKPDPADKLAEDRAQWRAEAAKSVLDQRNAEVERISGELMAMLNGEFQPTPRALSDKRAELEGAKHAVYKSMLAAKMLELKRPITREERKLQKQLQAMGAMQRWINDTISDCSIGGVGHRRNALERNLEVANGKFTDDNGDKVNRKAKPKEVAEAQAELDKFNETELQPWEDVLADMEPKIIEMRGRIARLQEESRAQ
jgi:hypothetical protein